MPGNVRPLNLGDPRLWWIIKKRTGNAKRDMELLLAVKAMVKVLPSYHAAAAIAVITGCRNTAILIASSFMLPLSFTPTTSSHVLHFVTHTCTRDML